MSTTPELLELALQLHRRGQQAEAAQHCRQLLRQQPDHINTLLLLGIIASQTAQFDEAIACFRRVLKLKPKDANTQNNLGNVLRMQGNLPEAIAQYQQAIAINPSHADAYYNLGIAFQESGDAKAAAEFYQRAIALQPNFPAALNGLGVVLRVQGQLEEAIASHQKALSLAPNYADAYDSLGNALREAGQLEEALTCHQQAIALKPTMAVAHYNLGNTWLDQGMPEEAIACYDRALAIKPTYHDARLAKAMGLLLSGNLQQGFGDYEARWGDRQAANPLSFDCPLWDGSPLNGARILLVSEQGLGDAIQFVRYAAAIAQQGGEVIVGCHHSLVRLMETVPGVTQVIQDSAATPQFDCYAPLLSLPRLLNTDLATIPATVPYVSPPQGYPVQLDQRDRLKVGLVWGARDSFASSYPSRRRSCPLLAFQRLLRRPGIAVYSLQKGDAEQEIGQLGWHDQIVDLSRHIHDFADTAAIAQQLDLIITVDTSVAHLSGALGKPVWLLLPFAPDWRWLLHRADSPWYPSMRLFRQRYPGDWSGVLEEVIEALIQMR